MPNDLTLEAKGRIGAIIRRDTYEKANEANNNNERKDEKCRLCKGSGSVPMFNTTVPCPVCNT